MSLHDKYFSETNKRHMFSLISDIVLKETGFPIQTDLTIRNLYDTQYPHIFDKVDTDSLVELNRVLLDTVGPALIQSVLARQPKQPQSILKKPQSILKKPEPPEPPEQTSDIKSLSPVHEEDNEMSLISLYSDDRLPDSKNRYHYQISLGDSDLGDRDYVHLKRIILPEEPNPLFGMPTIRVKVNEKTIVCALEDTKCLGDREYVSYVPEGYASKLQIPVSLEDPLTIDILDYKGHACLPHSDKITCNHLKSIVYKESPYLCVQVPEATSLHFLKGDTISLRSSDPSDTDIIKTVIQEIHGSYLLCQDVPVIQKGPWNLLNVSLQNNVSLM